MFPKADIHPLVFEEVYILDKGLNGNGNNVIFLIKQIKNLNELLFLALSKSFIA